MTSTELPYIAAASKLELMLSTIVETIAKNTPSPLIRHEDNEARFYLQVDGRDQGRFVGKSGAHIWAMQTLMWYAGLAQFGYTYDLRLLEPDKPVTAKGSAPMRFLPKWNRGKIEKLIDSIILTCSPGHACCTLQEETETTAVAHLKINKYLENIVSDPPLHEAFSVLLKAAGLSQGANIRTEITFG